MVFSLIHFKNTVHLSSLLTSTCLSSNFLSSLSTQLLEPRSLSETLILCMLLNLEDATPDKFLVTQLPNEKCVIFHEGVKGES